jgi:hypothetical protein
MLPKEEAKQVYIYVEFLVNGGMCKQPSVVEHISKPLVAG